MTVKESGRVPCTPKLTVPFDEVGADVPQALSASKEGPKELNNKAFRIRFTIYIIHSFERAAPLAAEFYRPRSIVNFI
jgi:hypothetical protein